MPRHTYLQIGIDVNVFWWSVLTLRVDGAKAICISS